MNELRLTDLIDPAVLQQMQDGFSRFTGLAALITDEKGVPVTRGSGFTEFCYKLTRRSEKGLKRCEECDKNGALKTLRGGRPVVYRCHTGLVDFAAPIMVEDRFIGSFIGGQVRPNELNDETVAEIAAELDIDPEEYVAASKKTYVKPVQEIEKAADFLFEITKIFSEMAYNNYMALNHSRKLERAARSQSSYIMNMSLNLEKNMTGWVSSAKKAVESGSGEAMESAFRKMLDESTEVYSAISDTVGYIRMAGGEVDLNESGYSIRQLMSRTGENVRFTLKQKGDVLNINIGEEVPEVLLGDPGKIGQIITKLIMNSAMFTENGSVDVSVNCKKDSYASLLRVIIADNGIGMTERQLESTRSFFDSTHVLHDEDYIEEMSFPVISLLIKQMGGKIDIESTKGEGTVFTITLPQLEIRD